MDLAEEDMCDLIDLDVRIASFALSIRLDGTDGEGHLGVSGVAANVELPNSSEVFVDRAGVVHALERAESYENCVNLSFIGVGSLRVNILLLEANNIVLSINLVILTI